MCELARFRTCTLGKLLEIKHGYAFKGEYFAAAGPYVLLTPGNFHEQGGLKLRGEKDRYYTGEFPSEYLLRRGDLLVAMTDLTQDAPILGSPAFVTEDHRFLHNQRLGKVVKLKDDEITPEFLYYLLNSPTVRCQIKGSATGATVRHTSPSRIYAVEVQLPSLPFQGRVAGVLSAYDHLIENSQRRIQILDSMARGLYRELFVNFRFPGHESHPRVTSALGEIPRGWEIRKLGALAVEMRRSLPKGKLSEPRPYVGLEHIPRRSLALDAWETTTELGSNKLEFKKGEVLFGKIRPYFHKVSIAPFDGLCSADTIVLSARSPELYGIVVACVSSDEFVARSSATANGAKMPRANWSVLKDFDVVCPDSDSATRFSALISSITAQQQLLVFQIQNLRRTRDLLLPRLLSGQIDVEAIDP
jgi:type I restriction enzyme, S subunit